MKNKPQYQKNLKKHPVMSGKKLMSAMPKYHRPEVVARTRRMREAKVDRNLTQMGLSQAAMNAANAQAQAQAQLDPNPYYWPYSAAQFNSFPL